VATNDDVFGNLLADNTVDDDGLSHMLRDIEGGFLCARQLKKLLIMRKGGKKPIVFGSMMQPGP
jgi:hypothetical protein